MSDPFLGEIKPVGWNFAARGYSFANGQLLPIASNTALFSLYGTTYGGDGRSTFSLPDLQGRTPGHAGRGPGLSQRNIGQDIGSNRVSLVSTQIPSHRHSLFGSDQSFTTGNPAGAYPPTLPPTLPLYHTTSDGNMSAEAVGETGSGSPHDNNQPYLTVNYLVALQGIYPSRS